MNEEPLGIPPSLEERQQNLGAIHALHPANRFRLMFGQSLLPEPCSCGGKKILTRHEKSIHKQCDTCGHEETY